MSALPHHLRPLAAGTAAGRHHQLPAANAYLKQLFIPDFNRRFTVAPAQPQSASIPMARIDLELLLSAKHERVVRNDNTVTFKNLVLLTTPQRMHFVRCPVVVHQFPNATLGVSYQGRLLARCDADAAPLHRSQDLEARFIEPMLCLAVENLPEGEA